MKKIYTVLILCLLILAATIASFSYKRAAKLPQNNDHPESRAEKTVLPPVVDEAKTDFWRSGNVIANNPGMPAGKTFLIYEEPGKPALTSELAFDESSYCGSRDRMQLCALFNATLDAAFKGERVSVEGVTQGDKILVRKLQACDASSTAQAGHLYMQWSEALQALQTCQVTKVIQSHDLSVDMDLNNGTRVRTIEPAIDEVMKAASASEGVCGKLIMATE